MTVSNGSRFAGTCHSRAGEAAIAVRPGGVAAVDPDDPGAFGGHRLEHEGVYEAEGGGVGANPEGQDQHGDGREPRVFQQEADGMPDVLKHRLMDGFRGGVFQALSSQLSAVSCPLRTQSHG